MKTLSMSVGVIIALLIVSMAIGPLPSSGAEAKGARSSPITLGPYLQSVTPTSITVCFRTANATIAHVEYGIGGNLSANVGDSGAVALHQLQISGLSPDTVYNYRIKVGNYTSPIYTFKTAPGFVHPFDFLAYGDTRSNHTAHRSVVRAMANYSGDFVLNTGDMVSDGTDPALWPPFFDDIAPLSANRSYYTCLGNHENNADLYYSYFALPGNERWYSFDYGQVHFIVLDNNDYTTYMQGSAQYQWLKSELAANQQDWKFLVVMFHQPPYSGSNRNPNTLTRNTLCPLFEQYGVDLVLNGHDHYYCHSFVNYIHYVVTGGGGAPLYDPYENGDRDWIVKAEKTYHFLHISVNNGYMTVRAIRPDGSEIENFTIEVQNKAPAPPNVWATDTFYDNGGSITVEWSPSADDGGGENDVQNYFLYRMDNVSNTWGLIATLQSGQTRYIDEGVQDGIQYYYMVVVTDGIYYVQSNVAGPVLSRDDTVPEPPTNLVAEDVTGDNGGNITLSWVKSPASDVKAYYIYRDTDPDTSFPDTTLIANVPYTEHSYVDSGLANNIPYYYCVRAWDGTNLSPKSNVYGPVTAKWDDAPMPPPYFTAHDVEDDDGGAIELEWHLSPDDGLGDNDVVEYHIYRRSSGGAYGFVPNITVPHGTADYVDSFVSNDIDYYYYITAFDGYLESEGREYGPVRAVNNHIPSPPTDLKGYNIRDHSLYLRWSVSPEPYVIGYSVYINASPVYENIYYGKYDGEYEFYVNVEQPSSGDKAEVLVDGLMESTTYAFKVVAYTNKSAYSPFEDSPSIILSTLNPPNIGAIETHPEDILNQEGFTFWIYATIDDLDGAEDVDHVTIDLSSLGMGTLPMRDDGSGGDNAALDGTYTIELTMPANVKVGSYKFTVNATDRTHLYRIATSTLIVKDYRDFINEPPEIVSRVPESNLLYLHPGENITLSINAMDPEGGSLEYSWYINTKKTGSNEASFTFYAAIQGDYVVKVIVKDNQNQSTEAVWSVSVSSIPTESGGGGGGGEESEKKEKGGWDTATSGIVAAVVVVIILLAVLYILRKGGRGGEGQGVIEGGDSSRQKEKR